MGFLSRHLAIFLVIAAVQLQLAATANFNLTGNDVTDPVTYIASDLSASPTITAPQLVCTGDPAAIVFDISGTYWKSSSLYGVTTSGVQSESELQVAPSTSANYPVRWLTQAQSDALYSPGSWITDQAIFPNDQWGVFLSGIGVNPNDYQSNFEKPEAFYYKMPGGFGGIYPNKHLAYAGLFCRGVGSIQISNGGPSFNNIELLSQQTTKSVTLPGGTYNVSAQIDVSRCIGAIRNIGSYPTKSVRQVKNDSFTPPPFVAQTRTFVVENRFACSASVSNPVPNPVSTSPGASFSLNFDLVNSAIRPMHVDSITLSTESQQYFDTTGTTFTLPADIAAGATGAVSGTVKVKSSVVAPGTYPLKLDIAYHSTQADCSGGNNIQCNAPGTLIVQVNLVPGQSCSLAFSPSLPGNNITQGASAPVVATCQNPSTCPSLTWTHTASSATTLIPPTTAAQASPQSTLTVAASEPVGGYTINATSGTLVCNGLPFNVVAPPVVPQTCTLSFVNGVPGGNIAPGGSERIKATCQNPATCPVLTWTHTAGAQATLNPSATPSGANPQTNLSIIVTATQYNGYAVNASNGSLACAGLPFNVAIPSNLPNYVVSSIAVPDFIYVGETFTSNITTSNIGNGNATAVSITNVTFPSSPIRQITIAPLSSDASHADLASFTCPAAGGTYTETAYADATNTILESDEGDNSKGMNISCNRKPTGCSAGFASHSINFTLNDFAQVNATCFDPLGQLPCPALNWSHNAVGAGVTIFPPQTPRAWAPSSTLAIGANAQAQLDKSVSAVSAEPGVPLSCSSQFNINPYQPGAYVLNCSFPSYGANPSFFAGQTVVTRTTCTRDGVAYCPGLNWSVSIFGAALQPNYTAGGSGVPRQSNLIMPATEPSSVVQGSVRIECADPIECTASVLCPFRFSPTPNNMTCGCVNHGTQFSPNDWALIQANCTKTGLPEQVDCPKLDWETNISEAHFDPNPTSASRQPTTNFSTVNAPVPQSGYINAVSATAGITLQCAAPILPTVDKYGPDYIVHVRAPVYIIEPGATFFVNVNVTNAGNRNVSGTVSQTALLAGNCSSGAQYKDTVPLNAGQSVAFENDACKCESIGTFSITAVADINNDITNELDENNNRNSGVYVCGLAYAPTCFDYV